MGWRWIFVFSIVFALLAMLLIKDTPESKGEQTSLTKFDYSGLVIFIVTMLALNLLITRGGDFGWTSLTYIRFNCGHNYWGLLFSLKLKQIKNNDFIDFSLFKNKPYTGATISNFLLNAVAGTLVVANTYVQVGRGFTAFQSGMLSLGYLVAVLAMIRVGEKILQQSRCKNTDDLGYNLIRNWYRCHGINILTRLYLYNCCICWFCSFRSWI